MENSNHKQACLIQQVGKNRNGKARWWCTRHGASATGRYGVKLPECEAAYRHTTYDKCFTIEPGAYPGGIAIWGAVPAVYDTSGQADEAGIHVHARKTLGGDKVIDSTFPAVEIKYKRDLFDDRRVLIGHEAAVNFYVSRFLGRPVKHLYCVHCGELHLDADYFAVHPHRRHLCHACGKHFHDEGRSISNPLALLREQLGDVADARPTRRSTRMLDVRQSDFRGGIQIWASNPAIVWTSLGSEESGLHVHAYRDNSPHRHEDETFGTVVIDGHKIDESMTRHLMAQNCLHYLRNKIVSLTCPSCGQPHFDQGEEAFRPHIQHTCHYCAAQFATLGKRKRVVSNPLLVTLNILRTSVRSN